MQGASREQRQSEKTFFGKVWGLIPNLLNCLWFGGNLAGNAIEYSRMIRAGLEEMEGDLAKENKLPESGN